MINSLKYSRLEIKFVQIEQSSVINRSSCITPKNCQAKPRRLVAVSTPHQILCIDTSQETEAVNDVALSRNLLVSLWRWYVEPEEKVWRNLIPFRLADFLNSAHDVQPSFPILRCLVRLRRMCSEDALKGEPRMN